MTARLRPRAIVFDLDGTLVDSRRDLATAIDGLRHELGLPPLGVPRIQSMVGEGARVLVARALADAPGVSVDAALPRFLALYAPICTATTRPYPGIDAALAALAPRAPFAMLTNKPESMSRAIVAALGWERLFPIVVGGDTLPTRKPDPAGLAHVLAGLGVAPAEALLVGDSAVDAATAAAAGVPLALVTWGYGRPEELAGLVPALLLDRADQLVAALAPAAAGGGA